MTTVVLLTALDLEYQAVRQYLDEPLAQAHPAGTLFEVGRLQGAAGTIALTATGAGNVGATVLAERAIAMFQPLALLCTGIAGCLTDDIALGDIVVATKVYAHHSGRERDDGFLPHPRAWHASHELEQLARHVARTGIWMRLIPRNPRYQAPSDRPPPAVHFKPVASGDVVLTATGSSLATLLHGTYSDAAAVEMESAGIAQAAHLNRSLPMLSVRGISDQADTRKHIADAAGWQHIAAGRAAAFVVSLAALILRRQIPIIDTGPLRLPATSYKARHMRLSSLTDGQSDSARHARW